VRSPWAAARMGVVAAPAESPPAHARTVLGTCGRGPTSIVTVAARTPSAGAHGESRRTWTAAPQSWRLTLRPTSTARFVVCMEYVGHALNEAKQSRPQSALRAHEDGAAG